MAKPPDVEHERARRDRRLEPIEFLRLEPDTAAVATDGEVHAPQIADPSRPRPLEQRLQRRHLGDRQLAREALADVGGLAAVDRGAVA